jgi:hypothetical protein
VNWNAVLRGWKGILIGTRLGMIAFEPMLLLIKPILFKFLQSEGVKKMVIEILEAYVKKTDNSIDDHLVELVRQNLFSSK